MLDKTVPHLRRVAHQLGKTVRYGDQQFRMPGYFPSRLEISSLRHEAYLETVLRRLLTSDPGAFIDVGANVGQTLAKVLGIDRDRRYVGFEPQLTCCFNIEQFLRINGLRNACVLPVALSDWNGVTSFYSQGETDEMATLDRKSNGRTVSTTYVQSRAGDQVLRELNIDRISAIKIDVEGAELRVLRGLKETLKELRPPVIFEVLPNFSGLHERVMHPPEECRTNQAAADEILELFRDLSYEVSVIDDKGRRDIKIDGFELNDRINFAGSNYLATPRVK